MKAVTMPREDEWHLCNLRREKINPTILLIEFSDVWEEKESPGLATHYAPIVVDLRPGAALVRNNIQYLQEACLGIRDHIQCLQDAEILTECQCPWNTPLLPVKESGGNDHRPVQGLCDITSAVVTIHPVVPDPYLLLRLLPSHTGWFTCFDHKATSFWLWLSPACHQPFFAFEREDPPTGRKTQLTWTRLPQGFKNSPTLFGKALAEDLAAFYRETFNCTLLQYVDVLWLASPTQGIAGKAPNPC